MKKPDNKKKKLTKAEQNKLYLKPPFSADNQPTGESKSNGRIEQSKQVNVLLNAETLFENRGVLPKLIENINNQADMGNNKDALDLMKLFKKNENSTNINVQGVQKVFVTQEELDAVNKHIDDIIGE